MRQDFLIKEYEKLKDEQRTRIDYRDRLSFVTLGAVGAVFSFSFEKPDYNIALLVLPFVCIVLGWTYLINDQLISSIGNYLRTILIPNIEVTDNNSTAINLENNWEYYHKQDLGRKTRKRIQFVIDVFVFCVSGVFSISCYFVFGGHLDWQHICFGLMEILFLILLATQFYRYSELMK